MPKNLTIWKVRSEALVAKSMRELDSLADRIRLHRQRDKRPVAIVEGQSDKRVLQRSFGDQAHVYFQAGTRSIALDAATKLHDWGQRYFVCVVDRDFDDTVEEVARTGVPLHPYFSADLEAMLSIAGAAAEVLEEIGSSEKIEARGGSSALIQKIYSVVEVVSTLRRVNFENGWGLAFDEVDLSSKIDKKNLMLKVQSYCAALDRTSDDSPGQFVLMKYANGELPPNRELACPSGVGPYFRGRDFLAILSAALCGYCGTKRAQSVQVEDLAASLRLAGSRHLQTSSWAHGFLCAANA
ncbi:hypothetical protein [Streptomyces cucumeris]|uniref:hypothetical protein n=1 Tax=Streptomyces cucumeris TaxID=2962890 RepID=UPI003D71D08F